MDANYTHTFLFHSLDGKSPRTARLVHIRRLFDILHLSIQSENLPRARRAYSILLRCKEVDWKTLWKTGLLLLSNGSSTHESSSDERRLDFLRIMLLQHPEEQEAIMQELVLLLVLSNREREALDKLEFYLPSYPYHDNSALHTYAGLICLYLAQPALVEASNGHVTEGDFDASLVRTAQSYLERARALDADGLVAQAFLDKIPELVHGSNSPASNSHDNDSEGETMGVDEDSQRRKRIRT